MPRPSESFVLEHPEHIANFAVDDSVLTAHLTALTGAEYQLQLITPAYLQTVSDSQLREMADVANEPLVRTFYIYSETSIEKMRSELSFYSTCWTLKRYAAGAVITTINGSIRGMIALEACEGGAALMYWISDADRGIMSQAVLHIIQSLQGSLELTAQIHRANQRSMRLAERCGFLLEESPNSELQFWVLPLAQ